MDADVKMPKRISALLGGALLLAMVLFYAFAYLETRMSGGFVWLLLLRTLSTVLVFIIPMLFLRTAFRKEGLTVPASAKKASLNKTLVTILSSFGLIVIAEVLYAAVFPTVVREVGVSAERSFFENILLFLAASVVPAAVEEIFFRGVVLRHLRVFRTSLAILMSALIFALFHFSVTLFPLAFVCGWIISAAYVSTGSLFAAIGIHFLENAFWFFSETVQVCAPEMHSLLMRGAVAVCVLLSSAGLPFLKENVIAFLEDEVKDSAPSSRFWSLPMLLFIAVSVIIQLLF